jgi:PilZ domain
LDERPVETTLYSLKSGTPEPEERRISERHLSLLRVGALTIGDRRELCLIRNISAGGMLIRAYSTIEQGARLSIELKQGEPISGFARWIQDETVGVTFDSPIDVLGLISATNDGQRPRMPRMEVRCTAWVREGSDIHRMKASNISQGGIRVEGQVELPVGTDVIIVLNGLAPLPGSVRWQDGSAYGITFNRVIALPDLVAWLQEQRDGPRAAGASLA